MMLSSIWILSHCEAQTDRGFKRGERGQSFFLSLSMIDHFRKFPIAHSSARSSIKFGQN